MNPRRTLSTTSRVLRQLRHDRRTIALILFMPSVLLSVLYYVFENNSMLFGIVAPRLLGIIPFTLMFIVTSVAVLRERTTGTLERLLVSPASRLDVILGYAIAFSFLALIQASLATWVLQGLFDVSIAGSLTSLLAVAVLAGVLGMSLGLLFSAFAKNEFQAVQFMPAFVLPQFLTCGLVVPREQMHEVLQGFASLMPITYAFDAIETVRTSSTWTSDLTVDVLVVVAFIVVSLVLGAISLKK